MISKLKKTPFLRISLLKIKKININKKKLYIILKKYLEQKTNTYLFYIFSMLHFNINQKQMKKHLLFILLLVVQICFSQSKTGSEKFWEKLSSYCGQSFEGEITSEALADDSFTGKKIIMHVKSCEENRMRIPFFVGNDKSRTWILTTKDNLITLKHDHRLPDGTPDEVTQYGGTTSNTGLEHIQFFPADQETYNLIDYAATNVWWITVDDNTFTYNLIRIGSERVFTITFNTTKPVETPDAPWGWKD